MRAPISVENFALTDRGLERSLLDDLDARVEAVKMAGDVLLHCAEEALVSCPARAHEADVLARHFRELLITLNRQHAEIRVAMFRARAHRQ